MSNMEAMIIGMMSSTWWAMIVNNRDGTRATSLEFNNELMFTFHYSCFKIQN